MIAVDVPTCELSEATPGIEPAELPDELETRGTWRSDYFEQLAEIEAAKDRMRRIVEAGSEAYGSRRAFAEVLGVAESTLRHHAGVKSKGRGKPRRRT